MDKFIKIFNVALKYGKNLKKLNYFQIEEISNNYPGVPQEYLNYLKIIGSGDFIDNTCAVYSAFGDAEFVYSKERAKKLNNFLIIGDDYQGYCFGYDANSWRIVECDPISGSLNVVVENFYDYLIRLIESYHLE